MKGMFDIGLQDIKNVMAQKGFRLFGEGIPNIVGIRNASVQSNTYNDKCWVWWNENGAEIAHDYTISTHPGFYYLQKPILGTTGTAILVPGQYIECWVLGMHRKTQFALVQHAGEVSVYRDNNRDTIQDYDPKTIQKGYFGIDLHHGSITDSDIVDRYSAGCQVWKYAQPHEDLMGIFQGLASKYSYAKFSYTVICQQDFN